MGLTFDCSFTYRRSVFELKASFETGGGVTSILGPSGSGKTTLVKLVAGLLRPIEGRIACSGSVFVDTSAGVFVAPERRNVGLVMQDSLLFPHLSVEENLRFGTRYRDIDPDPSAPSLDEVVSHLEIGELLHAPAPVLSGGQARRVALGRALLSHPRLLILDEPFTGLDTALRDSVIQSLQSVLERWPIPTLLVTHDPPSVQQFAERSVYLINGRLAEP